MRQCRYRIQSSLNKEEEEASKSEQSQIMVHITGAVNQPGVVLLYQNARLIEAIELVGGLTEAADVGFSQFSQKITG